ncbi:ferredoxin family protein [Nocardia terpenica]|uniref:Ferredoxin family protein n=1 Tax=Nocardia terpenica TaxID=455432 RepID=A0A6G9Z037_9NOCA|nr:ferredoxin family protein [Nocardia terpenica]QIS18822.1 ferredoxin family protein [Nocardia terpenica]
MAYVIGEPCVDVMDRGCVDECPVEAIYYEGDLPPELEPYRDDNAAFFAETLSGREEPLGSPGGATKLGSIGVDTPLVARLPKRSVQP